MKPPVALFKKKSRKLCLFLKAKNQILSTQLYVVYIKRKSKENCYEKIIKGKGFLKIIFYFLFEFQE